jgi:Ni,Fe-hydrogenase III small subunit/NAD-dependent dihydropyrimidine dehydrogenase PreA subunit
VLRALLERLRQGNRTLPFPPPGDALPERFRGKPALDPGRCREGCRECEERCPTGAITAQPLTLDLGRCLFCDECVQGCPTGAIRFTSEYRMAATRREDLVLGARGTKRAEPLDPRRRRLFRRSLKLRQVSAGGSAGCELEAAALGNVVFDAGRFGIQFVASPRHADGVLVTGPVTVNMKLALERTHDAVPEPKVVIAAGAAAISGGIFAGHPEVLGGADKVLPVDLYIPGHPPHPLTILDGLLRLLGRVRGNGA